MSDGTSLRGGGPSAEPPAFTGPLELEQFPHELTARVVTPGPEPRLHGYSVRTDLARHYGMNELWLLSLTGELPSAERARAFSVACWFLAPLTVAHASVHAAVLARLCGAPPNATLATAAIALSEHARFEVATAEPLLAWLRTPGQELPEEFRAATQEEWWALEPLLEALEANQVQLPSFGARPKLAVALWMLLFDCGLERSEQLEAALVFARLPSATAEAFSQKPCRFAEYAVNLPRYVYRP